MRTQLLTSDVCVCVCEYSFLILFLFGTRITPQRLREDAVLSAAAAAHELARAEALCPPRPASPAHGAAAC